MKRLKATLNVTNQCNLNCAYCYVDKCVKTMTYGIATHVLNNVREMSDTFAKEVCFFGGEPSLAHNLIKTIILENPDFVFSIISNGYRLFYENDYAFYSQFSQVSITIEGTEKAYNVLRGSQNLTEHINKVIKLKNMFPYLNIVLNMSLNGLLLNDVDEFICNMKKIQDSNLQIHCYRIKGENYFKSYQDVYELLKQIMTYNELFAKRNILRIDDYFQTDTPYLCSFENSLTVSPTGDLITCSWDNEIIGNIKEKSSYTNILKTYSRNHKSLYEGCSTCEVPVGMCQVSCPGFIKASIKNGSLDILNRCCDCERVIEYMRREILYGD